MSEATKSQRIEMPPWFDGILHDPVKVRFAVGVLLFAAWYLACFLPIESKVEETKRKITSKRELLVLAEQVESLREETGKFLERLPEEADRSAWLNHLLQGVRERPIRLVSIDPKPSKAVGPHESAAATIVVEGTFEELERFLRWVEIGPNLQRIESFEMVPVRSSDSAAPTQRQLKIVVMKIMG
ncbi:hypothetical protein BH23PLA1_BH23PLA1_00970 [soil metagenome]